MSDGIITRAEAIVKAEKTAVIALIDEDGFPKASTISNIKTDGIKHAWFTTSLTSGKAKCLRIGNKAGLCYCDGDNNISLMGTIEILTEPGIKKELWEDGLGSFFPGGAEDPNYCVLKFTADKAVLWIDSIYKELDNINSDKSIS